MGRRPPTYQHERGLIAAGFIPIGVDEAGCGCLAGPVVAAAVCLPFDVYRKGLCPPCDSHARQRAEPYGRRAARLGGIRDSKLLSAGQRERLVAAFRARGYRWAIGSATVEEVDRVNIRNATYLAMGRAVEGFLSMSLRGSAGDRSNPGIGTPKAEIAAPRADSARNDSAWFALVDAWTIPNLPIPQRGIIHGDRLVKSIAAASIIAKVARDALMARLDRECPQYGFAAHKGYATAQHRAAILQHGLSAHHRRTFCGNLCGAAAT